MTPHFLTLFTDTLKPSAPASHFRTHSGSRVKKLPISPLLSLNVGKRAAKLQLFFISAKFHSPDLKAQTRYLGVLMVAGVKAASHQQAGEAALSVTATTVVTPVHVWRRQSFIQLGTGVHLHFTNSLRRQKSPRNIEEMSRGQSHRERKKKKETGRRLQTNYISLPPQPQLALFFLLFRVCLDCKCLRKMKNYCCCSFKGNGCFITSIQANFIRKSEPLSPSHPRPLQKKNFYPLLVILKSLR